MKKFVLFAALLSAAVAVCAQNPSGDQNEDNSERIRVFDSHITVSEDGSMMVRETITVTATGDDIRHGIYRDFPTKYDDHLGNHYSVGFDIVSVERDGKTEAYHTSDLQNGVRVYFGSSNYTLAPGKHTYVFTYRTSRQLGFFKDHDELYWNVTGVGWMFPIDAATATVELPEGMRYQIISLDGYTGPAHSKAKAFTTSRDADANPVFRAENLGPHEGLTVVVTWPKGLIREPTAAEKRQQFIADNRALFIGAAGLALVLAYYVVVWTMVGRDPRPGSIVPLYEPQDNLSPAAMRFLEQEGFDDRVFTSAILGLAAKGYLTIENEDKTYRLLRRRGYGTVESKLANDEKLLAEKLFENGDKLTLTEHNAVLQAAQKALKASLENAMEKKYFVTNQRYLIPGLVLTALTVAIMVLMSGGSGAGIFMCVWLTGWSLGVALLLVTVFRAWRAVSANATAVFGAVFITLFSLPFLAGECFGVFMLETSVGWLPIGIIFAGIGLNIMFHYLMKAPTLAGRALMDRVEGFRMFLSAVDRDKIRTMAPPVQTPELFERFLPYALALGVEDAWARQLAQVLAAAASTSSQGQRGYSPSWYTGASLGAFSAAQFTSSFSSAFSSAVSSASAPASSSSGGGGGGSSGGGGGGGGW
ncbi:MAG TPA: DUF2207 domain-containing protein [Candidatus Angelobacter sp.]|nr:DUF2207 domain-containing protein [Candidatus Angelobacter sp.]